MKYKKRDEVAAGFPVKKINVGYGQRDLNSFFNFFLSRLDGAAVENPLRPKSCHCKKVNGAAREAPSSSRVPLRHRRSCTNNAPRSFYIYYTYVVTYIHVTYYIRAAFSRYIIHP